MIVTMGRPPFPTDAVSLIARARAEGLQLSRDRDHLIDVRPPWRVERLIQLIRKHRDLVRLELDRERLGLPPAEPTPRSLPEAGGAILAALSMSPLTLGDLADTIGMGLPELSRTVRELSGRGLVRQVPGTGLWVPVADL